MFLQSFDKYEEINHVQEMVRKISTLTPNREGGPLLVAICGAADLGKSYLSTQLVSAFEKTGTSACHLTLDSYLTERSKRVALGISGYQPVAYNMQRIKGDLVDFLNGRPIEHHPYDHATGKPLYPKSVISPCRVLFLDGLHSMHPSLMPYLDYSIFVCASDDLLLTIRHRVDIEKRKLSVEYSKSNLKNELSAYKLHVEAYASSANVIYELKGQWQYERIF